MLNIKKHKILITGCMGGIGSALLARMSLLGWNVDGLDTIKNDDTSWPHKSHFIRHDLTDQKTTVSIVQNYNGVIHLAGFSRVRQSKNDPLGAIKSNILCTANILESARLAQKKIWVLIASSLEVKTNSKGAYGLTNMYGTTKAVAELLAHRYVHDHGIKAGVVRLAGVYGSLRDQQNKVPLIFIKKAIMNKEIRVIKNSRLMDYIHIDDVCSGLISAAKELISTRTQSFFIYKLYSHKKISLKGIAEIIIYVTKSKSRLKLIKDTKERAVKVFNKNNFRPKKDLKTGLTELAKKLKTLIKKKGSKNKKYI